MLRTPRRLRLAPAIAGTVLAASAAAVPASAAAKPFLAHFSKSEVVISSTVPTSGRAMGDQNPYGVAVVRRTRGKLVKGDVLVSNFNNGANSQGNGSSIMEVSPSGSAHVFAVVPPPTSTPATGSPQRSSRCAAAL